MGTRSVSGMIANVNMSDVAYRCLQCEGLLGRDEADDVFDGDGDLLPLHRGGCPPKRDRKVSQ